MSVVETLTTPQPGQVAALPVDQVHPSPDNVRSDLGDVSAPAATSHQARRPRRGQLLRLV